MMTMQDRLNLPQNWQTLGLSFVLWAVHFAVVYAAELIMPNNPAVRWIALAAALAAWLALFIWWRRLRERRGSISTLAMCLAALAIGYQTLPALIG